MKKHITCLAWALSGALALTACGQSATAQSTAATDSAAAPAGSSSGSAAASGDATTAGALSVAEKDGFAVYSYPDAAYDTSAENAATLNLTETTTIGKAGSYLVSGSIADGQLVIEVEKDETVHLILDGVSIACADGPAIWAKGGQVIITLAEGTTNTLADGAAYADTGDDAPDAALYSKDALYLNGTGTLQVTGSYADGIVSKDELVITGGVYEITAADDALRGRDGVAVADGSFTITAGGDGLKASNDTDADKGWVQLDGGTFTVAAQGDAVQAETTLQVTGGSYDVTTGGGAGDAVNTAGSGFGGPGWQQTAAETGTETTSTKGLKAGTGLWVVDGSFAMNTLDDALHTNGNAYLEGGSFIIATGDDGVHADNVLVISGGNITITQSYEGLEAADLQIAGGTITLTATDDGVNAAGGSDGEGTGFDRFASSTGSLTISGGSLTVNAAGDGLDANGSVTMSGGTVIVNGPTDGANGALDYDGSFTLTGGVLVTLGSSQMAQTPTEDSTQTSITVLYSTAQAAGTTLTLAGADGTTLYSVTAEKSFSCVTISTPDILQGSSYTLSCGGTATTVTPDTAVCIVSQDGTAASLSGFGGGMGGGMNGGMGGKDGRFDASAADGTLPEAPADGTMPERQMDGTRPNRGTADSTASATPDSGTEEAAPTVTA